MVEAKFTYDKDRPSLALQRLAETLKVNLGAGRTIFEQHRELHKAVEGLQAKRLEEILHAGDAGVVAGAIVLDRVFDAATPLLVDRQCVTVITKDTSSVKVPKAAKATADWVAGSGNVPISEEDYSFTTVTAKKAGCRPVISRDMIEDAEWDVVERQLAEGARAMAEFENKTIVAALVAGVSTNTFTAASSGTLAWADIAKMIGTIMGQNYQPDTLVVHPNEYGDLLKDSAIQNLLLYGKQDEFVPGGRIFYVPGLKILVTSSGTTAGTALVLDSKAAAVLFIRRDITLEDYDDPINDLYHAVFTARWNHGVIDEKAMGTITSA